MFVGMGSSSCSAKTTAKLFFSRRLPPPPSSCRFLNQHTFMENRGILLNVTSHNHIEAIGTQTEADSDTAVIFSSPQPMAESKR
ncbi:hypothetical protein BHM03_00031726 [Ensete ventricosum]|nr:hypothetical protein BHM03_00031726 [Ensete ventricosum]